MKKRNVSLFGVLLVALTLSAEAPAGYYEALNGKSGKDLFDAVHAVAKSGYSSLSYKGLWTAYKETDLNSAGKIWDMYGGCTFTYSSDQCGNYTNECDCYNREHSIPKSWFGGSEGANTPGSDIFHIVPTDGKVNGMRSNYAFGEVSSATYSYNGSKLGSPQSISVENTIAGSNVTANCSSSPVFEPIDEYKGDFARGYMGTMVRWANGDYKTFTTGDGATIFSTGYTASQYFGLTKYGVALLMKWHREDPVSQKEIDRNNGIAATQGNRNPFIDYPELAEYIWGDKAGEEWNIVSAVNSLEFRSLAVTPNPARDYFTITSEATEMHYQVISISGQIVAQGRAASGAQISTDNLAHGLYLLKVSADGKMQIEKLIISK